MPLAPIAKLGLERDHRRFLRPIQLPVPFGQAVEAFEDRLELAIERLKRLHGSLPQGCDLCLRALDGGGRSCGRRGSVRLAGARNIVGHACHLYRHRQAVLLQPGQPPVQIIQGIAPMGESPHQRGQSLHIIALRCNRGCQILRRRFGCSRGRGQRRPLLVALKHRQPVAQLVPHRDHTLVQAGKVALHLDDGGFKAGGARHEGGKSGQHGAGIRVRIALSGCRPNLTRGPGCGLDQGAGGRVKQLAAIRPLAPVRHGVCGKNSVLRL